MGAPTDTHSTRITRPGLRLAARVLWSAVAAIGWANFVAGIPVLTDYVYARPEPAWSAALAQLGLSPGVYVAYTVALGAAGFAIYFAVSAVIFWRRPDDGVAVFVSVFLLGFGSTFSPGTNIITYHTLGSGWFASAFYGLYLVASLFGWPLLVPVAAVFPDGRFVPPWMRYAAAAALLFSLLWTIFPQQFSVPQGAMTVLIPIVGVAILVPNVYGPIYRYRHVSTPVQRQQTKWFVSGFCVFILLQITQVAVSGSLPFFQQPGPATEMFVTASLLTSVVIPLSIMLATLRYRLWDFDFFVNRSLVYVSLTLLLAGVFAGGFLALRFLLDVLFGSGQAVVSAVAATFVVVALFNPARARLKAFVDRRLYGIGIDYEQAAKARPAGSADARPRLGAFSGLELLGRGGMGEVYRAQHPALNRPVAIKVLPAHLLADEQASRRFAREAQTIAKLRHPNVVGLHEFGESEGARYMVMEYVDGRSLAVWLKERGRFSLPEALPILRDIAAALDFAHGQGIVHRDVKPGNIMLEGAGGAGRGVLMDFGIAKLHEATMQLTGTSGFVGTLDYIAPEQIQGAPNVDGRADVYSLGVVAHEMLAGEKPFRHANPGAMIMAHLLEPPPNPAKRAPDLPPAAAEAVQRAMAKKPEERFPMAGDFVRVLASAVESIEARLAPQGEALAAS